jgi:hypothetical protein
VKNPFAFIFVFAHKGVGWNQILYEYVNPYSSSGTERDQPTERRTCLKN